MIGVDPWDVGEYCEGANPTEDDPILQDPDETEDERRTKDEEGGDNDVVA